MKANYVIRTLTGLPLSTRRALEAQLRAVSALANETKADLNATTTKLDADVVTGIDDDYNATNAVTSADVSLT